MNKSGTTHRAGPDRRLQGSPIVGGTRSGGKGGITGTPIVRGPIVRTPNPPHVTGGNTGSGNGNGNGGGNKNKNKPQVCHCKQDEHEERYGTNAMKCRCVKNKSRGHTGNGGIPAWEEQLLTDIMGMMGNQNPFGSTAGSGATTPDAYSSGYDPSQDPNAQPQQQQTSSPVALLLIAAGAGLGIWWYIRHKEKDKPKKHEEKAA